jgi:hypothetical protein
MQQSIEHVNGVGNGTPSIAPLARRNEPVLVGEDHHLHPIADPELGQDVTDVRFHGGLGEEEPLRGLGVGVTPSDLQQHVADAMAGTDVRLVLAGHTHVVSAGTLGEVPVWTGDPLATTLDGLAPGAALRGLATPSVSRVDLFPGGLLTTSAPVGAQLMSHTLAEQVEPVLARFRAALTA